MISSEKAAECDICGKQHDDRTVAVLFPIDNRKKSLSVCNLCLIIAMDLLRQKPSKKKKT